MLKFLHELGTCNFEMLDIDEETPLFVAVQNNNYEIVDYLVNECHVNI